MRTERKLSVWVKVFCLFCLLFLLSVCLFVFLGGGGGGGGGAMGKILSGKAREGKKLIVN